LIDDDPPDLTAVWAETQAGLPGGWQLDSLRCMSSGLAAEQRSDEWCALAVGPDGAVVEGCGSSPVGALRALLEDPAGRRPW